MKPSILALTTICALALQGWGAPLVTSNVAAREDAGKSWSCEKYPVKQRAHKDDATLAADVLDLEPQFSGPPWKRDAGESGDGYLLCRRSAS